MVWTLGKLIEYGHVGAAYCDECDYSDVIDPADFVPRVGFRCPLKEITKRLRCGKCRSKKITVHIHHRKNRRGQSINVMPRKHRPWDRPAER